ncbi:MAG: hypothetical protein FWE54_02290 [Methanimicrococcus sp.]|nr:hypothetical protein [Methanimicrococcus sp.]
MTNGFCTNCGNPAVGPDAKVCTNCGKPLYMTQTDSASNEKHQSMNQGMNQNMNQSANQSANQSLVLATALSFVWPGLGQLYNGKFGKGLLFVACYWGGLCLLIVPGLAVWIYAMWDAYQEAGKINRGEIPLKTPSFAAVAAFLFIPIVLLVLMYAVLVFFAVAALLSIPY